MQTGQMKNFAILKAANTSFGETKLCIIPEIETLVKQQLTPLPASYPVF
jgi:hypothetical protein